MTKKLFFCMIFSALLAFGQRSDSGSMVKMERGAAAQAWASASFLPENTPGISGGGIVVENLPNGSEKRAYLAVSFPGTYLLCGNYCDPINNPSKKIGEFRWDELQGPISLNVYDGPALNQGLPFSDKLCSIDVVRVDTGQIGKFTASVNPWSGEPSPWMVVSEAAEANGRYQLGIAGPLPDDAVVILGRSAVASRINRSPMGATTVVFENPGWLPPTGPTTLTICSEGKCKSMTFERRQNVPAGPSGKG